MGEGSHPHRIRGRGYADIHSGLHASRFNSQVVRCGYDRRGGIRNDDRDRVGGAQLPVTHGQGDDVVAHGQGNGGLCGRTI